MKSIVRETGRLCLGRFDKQIPEKEPTFRIRLLLLHEIDEIVGQIVQMGHAHRVELCRGDVSDVQIRLRVVDVGVLDDVLQSPAEVFADAHHLGGEGRRGRAQQGGGHAHQDQVRRPHVCFTPNMSLDEDSKGSSATS